MVPGGQPGEGSYSEWTQVLGFEMLPDSSLKGPSQSAPPSGADCLRLRILTNRQASGPFHLHSPTQGGGFTCTFLTIRMLSTFSYGYWSFSQVSSSLTKISLPVTILVACCCSCSVAKSCLPLCDPMDCSMPGLSVLHSPLVCSHSWPLSW